MMAMQELVDPDDFGHDKYLFIFGDVMASRPILASEYRIPVAGGRAQPPYPATERI
jgi:hypothetical protein